MKLLTDGAENNPILGFCLRLISQYGENWPPTEEVLAREFVGWLGPSTFLGRDAMKRLCAAKGINLSFISLPHEIRGLNCSFGNKREIVITDTQPSLFELHTLFHEFREMLEHVLAELGYSTIGPTDSLEVQAEDFAVLCRMEAVARELPAFLEMSSNIEKKWPRYFSYGLSLVFGVAYLLSCIFTLQMEEVLSEARRQRYVRT